MHRVVSSKQSGRRFKTGQSAVNTIILMVLGTCLIGCSKVEPWERGNFTKPSMSLEPWSIPAYMNNKTMEKALESSRGGVSLGGGGCGCG